MISVVENIGWQRTKVQAFTCRCGKSHVWRAPQQSPFSCIHGCDEILPDVSKMTLESEWRIAYHLGGRLAVKCGASL